MPKILSDTVLLNLIFLDTDPLLESWRLNAEAWTRSVREGRIESRRMATDAAIVSAVLARKPAKVLDAGCGEGWLARALAKHGVEVTGFDGCEPLVAQAQAAGGGCFFTCSYEQFIRNPLVAGTSFDVVVFNFALLAEEVADIFRAAAKVLTPGGAILVQTLHPFSIKTNERYEDGLREEHFSDMGEGYQSSMIWHYRTLGSWIGAARNAGLAVTGLEEPINAQTGRPYSMILHLQPA